MVKGTELIVERSSELIPPDSVMSESVMKLVEAARCFIIRGAVVVKGFDKTAMRVSFCIFIPEVEM